MGRFSLAGHSSAGGAPATKQSRDVGAKKLNGDKEHAIGGDTVIFLLTRWLEGIIPPHSGAAEEPGLITSTCN